MEVCRARLSSRVPIGPLRMGDSTMMSDGRSPREFGQPPADQVGAKVAGPHRILFRHEEKIAEAPIVEDGHLATPDLVRVGDDGAVRCLAENLRQARDPCPGVAGLDAFGMFLDRPNDVMQDRARTDAGQLVHVAHPQHVHRIGHRANQVAGQVYVQHRRLVHNQQVAVQRIFLVAVELQAAVDIGHLQQPVQSPGRVARGFLHALGRPAGGSRQLHIQAVGVAQFQDGTDGSGLAGARPSGQNRKGMNQNRLHDVPLAPIQRGAPLRGGVQQCFHVEVAAA